MIDVLYEDNHLLTVLKPAGLATMGLPAGEETLLTLAKDYIKKKYNKPHDVYLGVVSRLDVPVSGIVLFARTSKAAARLNEQFRNHTVEKIYLAIVEGSIFPNEADLTGNIYEDKRHRKVHLTQSLTQSLTQRKNTTNGNTNCPENIDTEADDSDAPGKEAKLHYRKIESVGADSLVEINLLTGRKHQIRAQLAAHGFPILGDLKYGAKRNVLICPTKPHSPHHKQHGHKQHNNTNYHNDHYRYNKSSREKSSLVYNSRIALHAYKLSINHPITGDRITFETPLSLLSRELPQILSVRPNERSC
ncbi:MAG: RluA family pseudouridine synthase [Planctomycetaceae bacterium]|jgi:23S rRNA pseudouridine1911/1915/1917 synthase|nr:RluA family pseudouridine synthase [Planctomycetaceae bacterium]